MAHIVPLLDRILVKPEPSESVRPSGLIIPATAQQEKSYRGTVLAVGPGAPDAHGNLVRPACEPGDVVLFTRYGGTEAELDGEPVIIFNIRDVLGILRADDDE